MATSSGDQSSPRAASDLAVLPSYPEMIVEAIASLREPNGSSQAAIARRIEAARGAGVDLPPSHPALVAAHLSRMSAAAELVAVAGGKYALPPPPPPSRSPVEEDDMEPEGEEEDDDESSDDAPLPLPLPPPPPAKRGRGRPPKVRPPGYYPGGPPAAIGAPPSDGLAVVAVATAPRRRGRPPKPRDPDAPPKIPRPRGRPRKNPLPDGMAPVPRPGPTTAKPRPQFAEVGFV
ncbi:hypothetical protein CFC21_060438 [Triticum aestivum]|uniref:H15 domain-containing protein n=3 Tax=Triticinae TaxID=1648030 RepID=A0A453H737_AEGTS|nr:HMG-Y-related protein A [Aegilops tauschii subsp. strangulata]XP_044373370.1 HMG-Y-related protein A-like [Triticum aestivum]KAF7052324.1 hypothetical protein CFC21_060438 [Triticum aestivum]